METCKTCEYFIPTFENKGICTENDAYVSEDDNCVYWEEIGYE